MDCHCRLAGGHRFSGVDLACCSLGGIDADCSLCAFATLQQKPITFIEMIQPRCYVIAHLSSSVVADCVQSLERHGWRYEVVPAVDGHKVTETDWQRAGVVMSDLGKMKRRPGAQGCWLSHFALWQRCVETDQPMVIMEHDAVVTAPWPTDLNIDTQLIKLYNSAECKINPRFGLWSKGSHAYTLTPSQATILIEDARRGQAQSVDKHLGDRVLPWTFYKDNLVILNPRRGRSTTSALRK